MFETLIKHSHFNSLLTDATSNVIKLSLVALNILEVVGVEMLKGKCMII